MTDKVKTLVNFAVSDTPIMETINIALSDINKRLDEHKELIIKNTNNIIILNNKVENIDKRLDRLESSINDLRYMMIIGFMILLAMQVQLLFQIQGLK